MRRTVADDSGFMALIDPDAYSGFVDADWSLEDLAERFRSQMARRTLLIWGTGDEGDDGEEGEWRVEITLAQSPMKGSREVSGSIVSSQGRLLLTNFESLTMAAQFNDVALPERHQQDLVLAVAPGLYSSRIARLSGARGGLHFLIEILPCPSPFPPWSDVPWAVEWVGNRQ